MICSSIPYGKNYQRLLGELVFKTKLKCNSDRFLMELSIWGALGFVNYEFERRRGSDTNSHFGCNISLLLIHF